ncbi:hypothetical protein RFI_38335, partial [Reticulomyxa filosa]
MDKDVSLLNGYSYICVNNDIYLFGGYDITLRQVSDSIFKYSIINDKWTTFRFKLPMQLTNAFALLSPDQFNLWNQNDFILSLDHLQEEELKIDYEIHNK